ncbi:MurR/RpiR family transcriptional regulator [Paracoccus shanxieyensis]|nr:MurR/RpiR family transcriptional regulator [Paracoccus shanxieyensis]
MVGLAGLEARIRDIDGQMTPAERRLAQTMLSLGTKMAMMTAAEVSNQAQTSQASATRFFHRLGYDGWADLRGTMRPSWGSPLQGLEAQTAGVGDQSRHLAQEVQNLTRTLTGISPGDMADAARTLVQARRIRIVGFRNSRTIAAHARALLTLLHDDVMAVPVTGMPLAEEAAALRQGDVVLAVGLRLQPQRLTDFLRIAREKTLPVILLSEPGSVELRRVATLSLPVETASDGPFDSYVAAFSVLHLLAGLIAQGPGIHDRLTRIQELRGLLDW